MRTTGKAKCAHDIYGRSIPRWPFLTVVVVILALLAVACRDEKDGGPAGPTSDNGTSAITVVTTLPVFADFAREAGGDRVDVYAVLPDGLAPDPIALPPEDIERVSGADVILRDGLDLETTAEDILFEHKRRGSPNDSRLGWDPSALGTRFLGLVWGLFAPS